MARVIEIEKPPEISTEDAVPYLEGIKRGLDRLFSSEDEVRITAEFVERGSHAYCFPSEERIVCPITELKRQFNNLTRKGVDGVDGQEAYVRKTLRAGVHEVEHLHRGAKDLGDMGLPDRDLSLPNEIWEVVKDEIWNKHDGSINSWLEEKAKEFNF